MNDMKHIILAAAAALTMMSCGSNTQTTNNSTPEPTVNVPTFSADSAYGYVAAQCSYGPRVMNSAAHDSCAQYIIRQFTTLGLNVSTQQGEARLYDGTPIRLCNIIASTPDTASTKPRIMICSHWDSRPWADHDTDQANHHTPIDGANDGASGVGVMMEIARIIQGASPDVGIDFVCFDAEDCGTPEWDDTGDIDADTWCIGSQYWAQHVTDDYPGFVSNCRYGILLDMVGGSNSVFYKESYSKFYAPNVVDKVWAAAQRLGYTNYFKNTEGGAVTDDHLQVNKAGIRCIDIIGSDSQNDGHFPSTWHTMNDNIQNIDRQTLTAVGQTLLSIIYNEQ